MKHYPGLFNHITFQAKIGREKLNEEKWNVKRKMVKEAIVEIYNEHLRVNITLVAEVLGVKYIRAKGYSALRELIIEEIQIYILNK